MFVQKCAGRNYHKAARELDAKQGMFAGATGPAGEKINTHNSKRVPGFVVGATFGGVLALVPELADLSDLAELLT